MQELSIRIYHPTLSIWSDHTFRSILKKFSSLMREIQYQEVMYLINSSNLTPSEKQSLRDKLKGPLNHVDSYYVEKVERGSLTITAIAAGAGFALLQCTLGESVKEAWKQVDMHKQIVDYLSKPLFRQPVLDRNFDRVFDAWNFSGFLIDGVEKTETEESVEYRINLKTDVTVQQHIDTHHKKMTSSVVVADGLREIERLEKKQNMDNF